MASQPLGRERCWQWNTYPSCFSPANSHLAMKDTITKTLRRRLRVRIAPLCKILYPEAKEDVGGTGHYMKPGSPLPEARDTKTCKKLSLTTKALCGTALLNSGGMACSARPGLQIRDLLRPGRSSRAESCRIGRLRMRVGLPSWL